MATSRFPDLSEEGIALLEPGTAVTRRADADAAPGHRRRLDALQALVEELDEVRSRLGSRDGGELDPSELEELERVTCRLRQAAAFARGDLGETTLSDLGRVAREESCRRVDFEAYVVRAGGRLYVLPTADVERVGELGTIEALGSAEPVELTRLERCFSAAPEWPARGRQVLILRGEPNALPTRGIVVDEVLGRQYVRLSALGAGAAPVRGVRGGVSLEDDRVALALELEALFVR